MDDSSGFIEFSPKDDTQRNRKDNVSHIEKADYYLFNTASKLHIVVITNVFKK